MFTIMKRPVAVLVLIVLVAGLAGCGMKLGYQGGASPSPSSSGAPASGLPSNGIPSYGIPSVSGSPSPGMPASAGTPTASSSGSPPASSPVSASASPTVSPAPSSSAVKLVPYTGIVEHLFFHPLVAYPELAFDGDSEQKGIDDYMVTVSEYNKILQSLYEKNYIIVNMNDVWSEQTDQKGTPRMVRNTLMIPEGKKPLILTYDDVNYYDYMLKNGFTYKLVIKDGQIWSYGLDPKGNPVYSQDLDAVTILDKFIKQHPDFSLNGAKGCLCLTGYEGILGYRTATDVNNQTQEAEVARQKEIIAVRPIIALLKATGWYFSSHTWGHINFTKYTLNGVQRDSQKWQDEVGSLIGPTKLMIYPHGARPDGDDVYKTGPIFKYLHSLGFRIFASVGVESFSKIKTDISAVICDRMHADGVTLRKERSRYLKFYDAALVFDANVRPNYGVSWTAPTPSPPKPSPSATPKPSASPSPSSPPKPPATVSPSSPSAPTPPGNSPAPSPTPSA